MPRLVLSVLALISVCALDATPRLQAQASPPVPYSIRDLGTFGGSLTSALAVSKAAIVGGPAYWRAAVVGYSRVPSGANRAFVFIDGALQPLGTLGGTTSVARSVNFDGVIVGESRNRSGINRAFVYLDGTMRDLGSLSGTGASYARAINDNGEIVGVSQTTAAADSTRAFIYRNGMMADLGVTFGGTKSLANDINGHGQVVGSASTAGDAASRAFLYDQGVTRDLGTLGGANSEATAVNHSQQVVGRSQIAASTRYHAFLHENGQMHDLGTLGGANSEALDINDGGEVVGTSQIAGSSAYRAFLWRNGTMIDLNTLLPANSGWVLERASGINFLGQIVGRGRFAGQTRAFAMTPPGDIAVQNFGRDNEGNFPRPIQAGNTLGWVLFVENRADPLAATNVTVTDTLSGAVEYVSAEVEGTGSCEILGRTLECRFPRMEDNPSGELVWIKVRPTAAGEFGHTARLTHIDQGDADPRNNEYTESNLAISLADLALKPATVAGGKPVGVNVTLTSPHPNGASVRMTSSNPAVFPVPSRFIHVFDATRAFNVVPAVVSAPTPVEVTASYGLVTKRATVTVVPPALSALQLSPTTAVGGCGTVASRVSLTGAARAAGAAVAVSEGLAAAQFPTALMMPAGSIIHTFTIPTNWVTAPQSGTVTATYGGASRGLTLTVRPVRARSMTLTPNPVRGGGTVTGLVTLECPAQTPVVVSLSTANTAIAAATTSSITIPAGQVAASFALRTTAVSAPTSVPIYARVFGIRRTAMLTVNP